MRQWIPGYEDQYKITDTGVVWSYKRDKPKKRALQTQMYDYDIINLSGDGKQTTFLVHQLVMITFGPPRPFPYKHYVITHLDKDKKNNNISNLKWILKINVKTGKANPVRATGIDDGDVIAFRTMTLCAKRFSCNQPRIRQAVIDGLPYKGYIFTAI